VGKNLETVATRRKTGLNGLERGIPVEESQRREIEKNKKNVAREKGAGGTGGEG